MPTASKVLRAAVYGRESKSKEKSVDDQVEIGEGLVEEKGWALVDTYRDLVSASRYGRKARSDWTRLRADLAAGRIDILVLWESSRGSRTLSDWVALLDECRDKGVLVHIISHDRTYDPRRAHDRKTLASDGVDAENEVERSGERVRRGVDSAARQGGFHGRIPYGYRRVIVGERKTRHGDLRPVREQVLDPDAAPIAREIITRVAKNEPLRAIVRDLNGRGLKSPHDSRWSAETVKRIVRNPAYVAQRQHNGKVHDAVWPELISGTIWRAANAVLDTPGRKTNQPGGLKHLLSYLGTAPCGGHWNARGGRYRCTADACVSIGQAEADEFVTQVIVELLSRPDARELFAPDDTTSAAARDELAALEKKLKGARASYLRLDGMGISDETMAYTEHELAPLIADAKRRSQPAGASLPMLKMLDAGKFGAKHARPVWNRLPLPARREIISTVCESIVLRPAVERISRWATDDERLAAAKKRVEITPRQRLSIDG